MFVSLVGKAQGHLEISNLIRAFYEHSPDAAVRQTGNIEVLHNDYLRFGFEVVQSDGATISSDTDFAVIENGKLRLVAGFFNPASLTSQEIINTAKQVYQAFNAGDMARWFTFFAPTFEWYAADNSPIADHSPYRGLDAVRDEVFPRLAALFPGMQLRADEILATEDKAIMLGYYQNLPQKTGGTTEVQVAHVLTFQNGKIVKFQQYVDTYKLSVL